MALFLLAGLSDCPYFAQLEYDFHYVSSRVPDMIITKKSFLNKQDFTNFKKDKTSQEFQEILNSNLPIIFREYSNINGANRLLGGFSEAREYLSQYYNYNFQMETLKMQKIGNENYSIEKMKELAIPEKIAQQHAKIVTVSVFDTVDYQIGYYFLPLLIKYLDEEIENLSLKINLIYEYDEDKANSLMMELEDCAYSCLVDFNLIKSTNLTDQIKDSKFVFIFDNLDLATSVSYNPNTKIIVHLSEPSKIEYNYNLNTLNFKDQESNPIPSVISTISFTYENVIKSLLANKLSGKHAGSNKLQIRSVQIENVKVYGKVGFPGKWQFDLSKTCIKDLENSAITLEGEDGFSRPLQDILINKSYLIEQLRNEADDRILNTLVNKRLVSESKAIIYGFDKFQKQIETHFISKDSCGLSLPHCFDENLILCLGLDGIKNSEVRNEVIKMNTPEEESTELDTDFGNTTEAEPEIKTEIEVQ